MNITHFFILPDKEGFTADNILSVAFLRLAAKNIGQSMIFFTEADSAWLTDIGFEARHIHDDMAEQIWDGNKDSIARNICPLTPDKIENNLFSLTFNELVRHIHCNAGMYKITIKEYEKKFYAVAKEDRVAVFRELCKMTENFLVSCGEELSAGGNKGRGKARIFPNGTPDIFMLAALPPETFFWCAPRDEGWIVQSTGFLSRNDGKNYPRFPKNWQGKQNFYIKCPDEWILVEECTREHCLLKSLNDVRNLLDYFFNPKKG